MSILNMKTMSRALLKLSCIFLVTVRVIAVTDSSFLYQERPCCEHHHIRHHKDHVQEFRCDNFRYYRTMYMDVENNLLYIGAMDRIFKLNMTNINHTKCEDDSLSLEPSDVARCVSKGKSEHFDCRNHVKVIQPLGDGRRLYVCGTNAHSPKDWILYANLTHLGRHEFVRGIGQGIAKCPYDPADNSTAVWVPRGNPGGLPALYSGTNAEFTKADPVIFRTDLYDPKTNQKEYSYKRTLKYDSKWLDKTDFVGSFDSGQYVFMFFRETAVEYMNCGKAVYSRVARVCKNDTGGKHILSHNWVTYLKARLNCSIPGEFPFYFNEIQSVYQTPNDTSTFYAVFTTGSSDGLVGSAICTYSMSNIQEVFAGKFKEQATSSSAWLPVHNNKVPAPRPGQCVKNTEELPDAVLNFIRSHTLMDEAVRQDFDMPVFYKRDIILTRLVVDRLEIHQKDHKRLYTIFYAGTDDGLIYKIVQWPAMEGSKWNLADIWKVAPGEPIRAMEISRNYLYVSTDMRVRQLPLRMCRKRYDSCVRCVLDPYCGWDKKYHRCEQYNAGLLQDASNTSIAICDYSINKTIIEVSFGQSLHLNSFTMMPEVFRNQPITWYHTPKDKKTKKYKIEFGSDRILKTIENGLVILSIVDSDEGDYKCYLGERLIAQYTIKFNSYGCAYPSKIHEYKKIYSDWCHEFEKYKSSMKNWEKKQSQCIQFNENRQNLLSNEIASTLR